LSPLLVRAHDKRELSAARGDRAQRFVDALRTGRHKLAEAGGLVDRLTEEGDRFKQELASCARSVPLMTSLPLNCRRAAADRP
jgi:hypothetical protein